MNEPNRKQMPPPDVLEKLNKAANRIVNERREQLGYPFDQETALTPFYQWLVQTGLCDTTLISVGSPYKEAWDMLCVDEFERAVVDFFAGTFGFRNGHWGFVTNGGTDGNLHGLYFGRKALAAQTSAEPVLYVSEEAHYSVKKLGDVLNIETRVIRALPDGRMDTGDFSAQLSSERPALIAIAVGGTFKGAIDDQRTIDEVLQLKKVKHVYRHLDVALFGGYLPWLDDEKAASVVNQQLMGFDSLAVSGHKFLAMNEPAGVFLCRKEIPDTLQNTRVPYLDCVMPTISCSRSGFDVLKLYWRIMTAGPEGLCAEANHVLKMTAKLISALREKGVEAFANPWSNTVCFPRPADKVVHRYALACSDGLSHVVVMQFFNEALLEELVQDIIS